MTKYGWIGLVAALVGLGAALNQWCGGTGALAGQRPNRQQASSESAKRQGDDTPGDRTAGSSRKEQTTAARQPAEAAPLEELAWLVGTWVDRGEQSTITTTVRWTKNRAFLTRSFHVITDGKVSLEGTQVIAWDPVQQQIRSWTFDSEGGFGEAIWLRDQDQWLIKKKFTLPEGKRASALNVITYVDDSTFRWKSINREIEGELLPNVPETTVVRRRAAPARADRQERDSNSRGHQKRDDEKERAKQ